MRFGALSDDTDLDFMMTHNKSSTELRRGRAGYIGWRSDLLAQLALARVKGLSVYKPSESNGFDYLVSTSDGLAFFVEVKGFSSVEQRLKGIENAEELRWPMDHKLLERARASVSPVVLFLFDVDTDHGRFLRLDTLPVSKRSTGARTVRLPKENAIDRRSIQRLVSNLRKRHSRTTVAG